MDKAPTRIDLAVELAEMMVNDTPPDDAYTAAELYAVYVEACKKAGREPIGDRGYQDRLENLVKDGKLEKRRFGFRNYYWRPDGR